MAGFGALFWLFLLAAVGHALAQPLPLGEQEWLLSWIPHTCCVTQRCCFPVKSGALLEMGGDQYRVVATGEVKERSGWSKDNRSWRCACDANGDGSYRVHDKAKTHCIFPTMQRPGV